MATAALGRREDGGIPETAALVSDEEAFTPHADDIRVVITFDGSS